MALKNTLSFILNHPINRRHPAAAMFRFLRWQLGSRLVPGDVVYPWINGAKMLVRNGETGFTQNIYCGLQEFSEMGFLLHVLRPEDLFVDVGANVGAYTILAGAVIGARVICFEPVPSTYSRLVDNLKINQLEDTVQSLNIGLSNDIGTLLFTTDQDSMNHVVYSSKAENCSELSVSKLDIYLDNLCPSLIKIDVEGFETRVLEGAQNSLIKECLHSLIVEINGNGKRYGFDESKIIDKLAGYGFDPYEYDPFTRSFKPLISRNPSSSNTLFIRDLQVTENRVQRARKYSLYGTEF